MYEYENSIGVNNNVIQEDTCGDFYFSFIFKPKKSIAIASTTYYQPVINTLNDYRISSETSLIINLFKNLDFTTTFSYQFDELPVLGIPKEQYELKNGITYTF